MTYTAAEAIRLARKELGYRETGENDTKFNRRFGQIPGYPHNGYGYPWCQSFQSIIHLDAGGRKNTDFPWSAGCAVATSWFKSNGRWSTSSPQPGDMLMYGPGGGTHVDMVTEVEPGRVRVIGGNTGGNMNGAYYNGNGVYEKWVDRSNAKIHGYGRPKYQGGSTPPPVSGGKFKGNKGQSIAAIAALLGVSVAGLIAANPFADKDKDGKLDENTELQVPAKESKPDPVKPDPVTPPAKDGVYRTTSEGETLRSIAQKLGISLSALEAANPGVGNAVQFSKGSEVKLPKGQTKPDPVVTTKPTTGKPTTPTTGGKPSVVKPSGTGVYVVQRGDTLWAIAKAHGLSLGELLALNEGRFPNPDRIFRGQKVYVKGEAKQPAERPAPVTTSPDKVVTPSKPTAEKPPVDQGDKIEVNTSGLDQSTGAQRMWDRPLTAAEQENAKAIYRVAVQTFGAQDGPRAAVIGIATAYQESRLQNLRHGHLDSLGLFQQRPSMDWGSAAQINDPSYAAESFYKGRGTNPGLKSFNWKSMSLTQAAQKVQRSGTPNAFAVWERAAAGLVKSFATGGKAERVEPPKGKPVTVPSRPSQKPEGETVASAYVKPVQAAVGTPYGKAGSMWSSGYHTGTDFPAPQGSAVVATAAGTVTAAGWNGAYGNQVTIRHANGVESSYAHLSRASVSVGQEVKQGQEIGNVGSTGNSTGPHLHLEFKVNGARVDPMRFIR
ncbi:peptidoglycan DD-metalloendopeptidase family protein [Streptomyces sp. NPDC002120]|uniref:peptidoglycan DD-metalloendopeptidase family protein n=1 Tax=Streptomyces sp. NPDC002120 TaxID=3364631 RepID=UPI0036B00F73